MVARTFGRMLAATLVLASSASSIVASAQPPGADQPVGTVVVPCCRCIGGDGQSVPISTGMVAWRVAGPGVTGPVAQTITANINPLWTASLPPARWVHANNGNGASAQPGGTYRYEIRIVVPRCVIPMRVSLAGRAAADDQFRATLDGNPLAATPTNAIASPPPVLAGAFGWGFRAERIASFSHALTPGVHILRFDVANGSTGPTGLLVAGAVTTRCSTALQTD